MVDAVYDQMMAALAEEGGFLLTDQQSKAVQDIHWQNGKMTTTLLAQDIDKVLAATGLAGDAPENTRFWFYRRQISARIIRLPARKWPVF